jgi:hypothetical protein
LRERRNVGKWKIFSGIEECEARSHEEETWGRCCKQGIYDETSR